MVLACDPGRSNILEDRLNQCGYRVDAAQNLEEDQAQQAVETCHAVILDDETPSEASLDRVARLLSLNPLLAIVVLVDPGNESHAINAITLGASDYLMRDPGGGYLDLLPVVLEQVLRQQRLLEERTDLAAAVDQQTTELQVVQQVAQSIMTPSENNKILSALVEQILQMVGADNVHLFLYDGAQISHGIAMRDGVLLTEPLLEPRQDGLTYRVIRSKTRIVVPNINVDPLFSDGGWDGPGGAIVGLPLLNAGRELGVINVAFLEPHEFSERELLFLDVIASHAAIAVEHSRFRTQLQQESTEREQADVKTKKRLMQQDTLLEASRVITRSLDYEAVLANIAERMCRAIDATSAYISDWDPQSNTSTVLAEYLSANAHVKEMVSDLGQTYDMLTDFPTDIDLLQAGEPVIKHVDDPDLPAESRSEMHQYGIRSNLLIPLVVDQRIKGIIECYESRRRREFTEEEIVLCQGIAQQAATAIENARLYKNAQDYAARLEQDVAARTSELVSANKQLRLEIVQRKNTEAVLQQSEQEYRELVEALQEGIWAFDKDARTTFVNKPMAEMLGHTAGEMQGKHIFTFMDEQGTLSANRSLEHIREGIKGQQELELVHKNGARVWTTMETAPLLDETGNYKGAISGVIDITKRRQAEVMMRQQTEHLKQVNSELEQYSWIIAHDLKAPLRIIGIYSDLLERDLDELLSAEQREYLVTLTRAKQQADELVQGLLALAYVGKSEDQQDLVSMKQFFSELIASLDIPPDVEITLSEDWPTIQTVKPILRQIFENLLTNAVKFNESSPKRVQIGWRPMRSTPEDSWTSIEHPKEYYEFFVQDNGIGIPAEYQEQVFGIFKRLHVAEDYQGTGVGLAIVRKAVGKLRGAIYIRSEPGEGSTFCVALPSSLDSAQLG
jgi:PAS domain S-box-containing protein